MLLKLGVDISRLNREARRTLTLVDNIYIKETGQEAVITSTYEGDHMASSLHYKNDAYDVRTPQAYLAMVITKIREGLRKDYDVILEGDHIHIEYDPK